MPSGEEHNLQGVSLVTIYGRHERCALLSPPFSSSPSLHFLLNLPLEGPLSQPPAERRGSTWKVHASPKVVKGLNQSHGRNIDKILSLADSFSPLLSGNSSQPVRVGGQGEHPSSSLGGFGPQPLISCSLPTAR